MTADPTPSKNAPLPWRWIVIGSTLAGLIAGVRILIVYRTIGPGVTVFDALVSGLMEWWLWILVAPLAMLLADRFELFRPRASSPTGFERRSSATMSMLIAVHGVGALVLTSLHLFLFSALSGVVRHFRFGDAFRVDVISPLGVLFVPGLLVYGVVVVTRWWSSSRRRHLEVAASSRDLASQLDDRSASEPDGPIEFQSGRGSLHLRPDEVVWVQAAGNYLELHTGTEMHLVRETLKSAHERLGAERFVQIHRSTIVRVAALAGVTSGRQMVALLGDGTRLPISSSYRGRATAALGLGENPAG